LLPDMPFKLTVLRYDCIVANFAKGFCLISRIGSRYWANFCSKFWILQPHMSKRLAASVYQEVFLPDITTHQRNRITWKYRAVG